MCCGSSPMLVSSFVMMVAVIWWLSNRLDEILKEVKKK